MAKPIKETPVLKGKDARNFLKQVEIDKNNVVSKTVSVRMKNNYDSMASISKF